MRRIVSIAALLLAFAARAQVPHAGSERVAFDSLDMQDGKPVSLFGWWIRSGQEGKRPAIVVLHGCGGLYSSRPGEQKFTARHAAMADLLHGAGYHVLFPDSFTPRGKRAICTEKLGVRDLNSANRRRDVLGALDWLAKQPGVDASRIALLGWSHGGSTVLSSINTELREVSRQGVPTRAAVAFYPGCSAYNRIAYRNDTPLLVLMGEKDDWTPPQPCIELAQRMESLGAPFTLRLYADSYHDFDAPGLPVRVRRDVPNGVHPGKGVTTGGNPQAREAAYREMLEFLAKTLK